MAPIPLRSYRVINLYLLNYDQNKSCNLLAAKLSLAKPKKQGDPFNKFDTQSNEIIYNSSRNVEQFCISPKKQQTGRGNGVANY